MKLSSVFWGALEFEEAEGLQRYPAGCCTHGQLRRGSRLKKDSGGVSGRKGRSF
jgi:hypothetical protein